MPTCLPQKEFLLRGLHTHTHTLTRDTLQEQQCWDAVSIVQLPWSENTVVLSHCSGDQAFVSPGSTHLPAWGFQSR